MAEGIPLLLQDGSTSYVTGPDGLPLEQISGNKPSYYYQDQLGSTRGMLDSRGSTVATYTYDPYGNLKSSTGSITNPFQYAGEYTDAESGLQYLQSGYYDSTPAQFLAVDPAVSDSLSEKRNLERDIADQIQDLPDRAVIEREWNDGS
jgi:RHS repeat-associated protein